MTGWVRRQVADLAAGQRQLRSAGFWREYWQWVAGALDRLAARLEANEYRRHAGVDVSGPGESMRLWCLACNEEYPCDRLAAMVDRETRR